MHEWKMSTKKSCDRHSFSPLIFVVMKISSEIISGLLEGYITCYTKS